MSGVERSSGNVSADISVPEADEMLVKAQLAEKIGEVIKRRRLSQAQAAKILAHDPAQGIEYAVRSIPRHQRGEEAGMPRAPPAPHLTIRSVQLG